MGDRQPPRDKRFLEFSFVAKQGPQIILHSGTGGIDFRCAADRGHRLRVPADFTQRRRLVAMRRCQIGVQFQRLFVCIYSFLKLARFAQHRTQIVPAADVPGGQPDAFPQFGGG